MKYLKFFFNWLTGNYWIPISQNNKWGVYHPTVWHDWNYPFKTKEEAEKECRRRNL